MSYGLRVGCDELINYILVNIVAMRPAQYILSHLLNSYDCGEFIDSSHVPSIVIFIKGFGMFSSNNLDFA